MKLYRFYKIPNDKVLENCDDMKIQYKYPLYAFTNSKKLYKKFKSERSMDNFYIMKSNVTKEEYVEFANTYSGQNLKIYDYIHYDIFKNYKQIKVLSTWEEREMVASYAENCFTDDVTMDYKFNIFILKPKYITLMQHIEFLNFWALYGWYNNQITDDQFEEYVNGAYPEVGFDEFNIFLYLYGELFFKRRKEEENVI